MSLYRVQKCIGRECGWQLRILPLDHRCPGNLPLLSCRLWSFGSRNERSVLLSEIELLRKLFKASYKQQKKISVFLMLRSWDVVGLLTGLQLSLFGVRSVYLVSFCASIFCLGA